MRAVLRAVLAARRRNPQIYNFDSPAGRFPALQPSHVGKPAQRALKGEILSGSREPVQFTQK